MTVRKRLFVVASVLLVVIVALVVRNQVNVYRNRQIRANQVRLRQSLFDMLKPVAVANCELERFGEVNDGGYLMCGNLLRDVETGYSYGIAGYDKWGCDISTRLRITLHEYDCFNMAVPACPAGRTVFHPECVDGTTHTDEGRFFDTIHNQFSRNGDSTKRVVLKIDVEGAEWNSFLMAPDDVIDRIDQMAVEFHGTDDDRYETVIRRLKQFFYVAHIHFNNAACVEGLDPFPTWAYEVLFVSKRLAVVDPSGAAVGLHPSDAPNNPSFPDCQPQAHRVK